MKVVRFIIIAFASIVVVSGTVYLAVWAGISLGLIK
jgi:hypothetical protein